MKIIGVCLWLTICIFPTHLWADARAKVESMQMPAWIKHNDGHTEALRPGIFIQSGDQLITGKTSRLLLKLNEGSQIKLGENAQLEFNKPQQSEEERGTFEAQFKVLQGGFRFSTTALSQNRKRNIKFKIGVITADIRGTDIWGKSDSEVDLLALLKGQITVQRDGEPEFNMSKPLSYYLVPNEKPAQAVQTVPQDKLVKWAVATELLDGVGVLTSSGKWNVNLMSLASMKATEPVRENFSKLGYATDVQKFESLGNTWYRIKINGFKTREDALTFANLIDGLHGIRQPWVKKAK